MTPDQLARATVDAMRRFRYQVFTGPGELNIVYLEGANEDGSPNGNAPNRFNDRRLVIRFEGGVPKLVGNWEATSEPGKWFTDNRLNPAGAARIKLGQWKAWRVGQHPRAGGHEAFVQDVAITVCRDGNRDYSRSGDKEETGLFGINQHWGYDFPNTNIGKASAGCLVGRSTEGHKAFMALMKTDPRYKADNKFVFTTTIMTVADLNGIQAPAPVRPDPSNSDPSSEEVEEFETEIEEEEEEEEQEEEEATVAYKLTWLPAVLRAAGLKVVEQPGWRERGHGDMGNVRGVLCHHTAGAKTGNAPSLNVVQNGRPDLSGPLSQLVLGRDGTYYVVAAGLCYHAGAGSWQGITSGNASLIGIEAENTGLANDPWPEGQMDAYRRGCAALLKKLGAPVIMCVGHKEYALPKGRKPDPSFDMNKFRADVAALMGTSAPSPVAPPTTNVTPLPLFERKAPKIMADLIRDFGFTETQAAGILGNIGHECGGFKLMQEQNPSSGIGGYGWAQWTGIRRQQFFAWCQENGLSVDSDEGNYGFLKHELTNTWEKRAVPAVKATHTLNDAMLAFERSFERAGIKHYESRLAYAQRALNAYRAAKPSVTPTEDKTKTVLGGVVGAGTTGTVAVGVEQGWTLQQWLLAGVGIAALIGICILIFYIVRNRVRSRNAIPKPGAIVEPTTEVAPQATTETPPKTPTSLDMKAMFDQIQAKVSAETPIGPPTVTPVTPSIDLIPHPALPAPEPKTIEPKKKVERYRPKTVKKKRSARKRKAKSK